MLRHFSPQCVGFDQPVTASMAWTIGESASMNMASRKYKFACILEVV